MDTIEYPLTDTPDVAVQPLADDWQRPARRRTLMVPPDFFCVRYAINPWMDVKHPVDTGRALAQWTQLHDLIAAHADVVVMPAVDELPDMCFSANGGLAMGRTFVPSNFRHLERRAEASWFEAWMRRQGFAIRRLPSSAVFEGAGDALFDREQRLWMGFGQRSDITAAALLGAMLDVKLIPLALRDPYFYHLDTCFCPLSSGHVVFYPDAFAPQSLDTIEHFIPAKFRIPVTREDAGRFACNMVDLGDVVIAHHASPVLREALQRAGREVQIVDLSEFIKAGGGAKCLTLTLN